MKSAEYWYDRFEQACAFKDSLFSIRTDFNLALFSVACTFAHDTEAFVNFKRAVGVDFARSHPPAPSMDNFKVL